jgi:hypothetical protein
MLEIFDEELNKGDNLDINKLFTMFSNLIQDRLDI